MSSPALENMLYKDYILMRTLNSSKKLFLITKKNKENDEANNKELNDNNINMYALKVLNFDTKELTRVNHEINIMKKISCENIVKFIDSFTYLGTFNVVFEYCQGGDLRNLINYYISIY